MATDQPVPDDDEPEDRPGPDEYPRPISFAAPTGVTPLDPSLPVDDPLVDARLRPWRKAHLPAPPPDLDRLPFIVTVPTVAAMCGVSQRTVHRWIDAGLLKRAKASSSGRIFLTRDSVLALLQPEGD